MRKASVALAAVAAAYLLLLFAGRADFPGLRWRVKTFRDPDRGRVRMEPVDSTVAALTRLPRPGRPELRAGSRIPPQELDVYRVRGALRWLFDGFDGDIHLLLADPADPTRTMIAEIPLPFFSLGSGFETTFREERERVRRSFVRRGQLVEVTGVGFFDSSTHNRVDGPRSNGFELHPVIGLKFIERGDDARERATATPERP